MKITAETERAKCNCDNLNQGEKSTLKISHNDYVEPQLHLKLCSDTPNEKPIFKNSKLEHISNEVKCELNENIEGEVNAAEEFLKKRGKFPISLIRQYFPKRDDGYTFDLLPLPFMTNLKAFAIREKSLKNEENCKSWKEFLHRLPESQHDIIQIDNRYWRWKMYKKYIPEERTFFRKTMSVGPKLDRFGRLPIPIEELNKFRKNENISTLQRSKNFLKKGDGHINSMKKIEKK